MKDLVVLVADKNAEHAVKGLLSRTGALGVSPVGYDLFVHPRRDAGCLTEADDFLRPFASRYRHALVMFDHQGCGQERRRPEALATRVKQGLQQNGWDDRTEVVVLAPELEVWVWNQSPHVAECLGWAGHDPSLQEWLTAKGYWQPGAHKPSKPKEALEAALQHVRKPRSSAIYLELARRVSLQGHTDPGFLRFCQALRDWFPPSGGSTPA